VLDLDVQLATLAAGAAVMVGAWAVSLPLRDASVADIAWGLVFAAIAWAALAAGDGFEERMLLIAVLVTIWALRLSLYIAWRHDGEDKRYVAMRKRQGSAFPIRSLFTVFLVQAAIAWVVSAPIQGAAADPTPASIGALGIAGAIVTLFGIAFEGIADVQLSRFLARKAEGAESGVMDQGLWRYSRHPNYFGNATLWFGIWLIALETGSAWWTVIGPVLMTFFLLKVSGVALTEKTIRKRRPGYDSYVERTSAFIPLPPRAPRTR
jgi:steroid 5-alpha reductase family enzyme